MSIVDRSEDTITRVPRVADVVGPDMLMDELSWEVRGKLLRCALSRTLRAMQLWGTDDEPNEPAAEVKSDFHGSGIPY